ncbi:NRDE family protein [Chryseobacterium daeguense]|uniref:NRDE family protein n=1 Tax=Chryseobacterium daeguense TaxID=412438 RepID=UPI000425F028|nr:NRDE family protein [Chryseobacterium daeguense]
MCTVSFFYTENALFFTSNRDEKRDREKAVFPNEIGLEDRTLYFPKDAKASGTWFVADNHGNAIILLNGAFQKHKSQPPYKKSRGIILLELMKIENVLHAFQSYDLFGIEPFQLLTYSQNTLFRLLWDGEKKHQILLKKNKNHLLSSATLYNGGIIAEREKRFKEFQEKQITQKEILAFHKQHLIEEELNVEESIKETFVTVSITQLVLRENEIDFTYNDLVQKKIQNIKIGNKAFV